MDYLSSNYNTSNSDINCVIDFNDDRISFFVNELEVA